MNAQGETSVRCDCGAEAMLVSGDYVYPHRPDLADKKFWVCDGCDTRVGCHPGTIRPLGKLANAETRSARHRAHSAFDPLWQSKQLGRKKAYAWLAEKVGVPVERCHIGEFSADQCALVVAACAARAHALGSCEKREQPTTD